MDGDEAGAEAFDAAVVLVAVALVDLALAAEFGVLRQHADAEALLPAIAAAFADQRIHHHPLLRIDDLAALAATTLLGGAGLVVDQDAGALHLAQRLLHGVELATVVEGDAVREDRRIGPLLDVVADQRDGLHAFGAHLLGDLRHGEGAVHRLAAGHRHRIVVEDLVGDVDAGGDRLADRQRAAMEVGAVAEVLEDVRGLGERRLAGPGHAFAAHVGEGVGAAVHPRHHVMATDAALRARAFRHLGAGVVRAAGAVMRHAREVGARQRQLAFLAFHPAQHLADVLAVVEALDARGDDAGDARRGELAGAWQDPFAGFVVLADDARALPVEVVEEFLDLRLDEGVLFLDHQDVLQPARERADADRFQRPGHADLVHADAEAAAGVLVKPEVFERLQHVEVALAGGDDAEPRVRRVDHDAVDAVRPRERLRGLDRVTMQAHLLVQRRIRPADVEAACGHLEFGIARQHDLHGERIDIHRGRGFHRFRDGLEADPAAGEARHREPEQAHVEDVLHAGRIEHRHHRADEFVLAAVRQGRAAAVVVVGGQCQHAAIARGACSIRVLEHVAAAVHAGTLAVPHAEHAIDGRAGEQAGLLGAPDHGRAQVLVEARLELHLRGFEVLLGPPQLQVEAAQRRAAIAGDEAGGVQPGAFVAQLLHQRQPHQRLHPAQVDAPLGAAVLVLQRVVGIDHALGQVGVRRRRRGEFGGAGHGDPGAGDALARLWSKDRPF